MTTTNNMGITLPQPGATSGPQWASDLNNAISVVDAHDHSSGKGVKVTPAGFSFTSDMPCGGFKLTDLGAAVLRSLSVSPTVAGSLHVKNGDLYHVSSNGTAVQITSGTGLNLSSTGTIGGDYGGSGITASATYSNALKTFSWLQNSGITAKMFCADVLLTHPSASQNSVTLRAQSGSAAYEFAFPLLAPVVNDSILCVNTSGVNLFKNLVGTSNQVTITSSAGALTFSLPQAIHTAATPTFAGMTLTGALSGTSGAFSGAVSAASITTANSSIDGVNLPALAADYAAKIDQNVKTTASPTFAGATLSGLSTQAIVATDNVRALVSLTYGVAASNSSVAQRTGAGRLVATGFDADGYSVLGDDSPAFKVKKLTGFLNGSSFVNAAHGLTDSARIKCVDGRVFSQTLAQYVSIHATGAAAKVRWDNTNIQLDMATIGGTSGQSYVIYLTYEAS